MDDFGGHARNGLLRADDGVPDWSLSSVATLGVAMIPGGQVERRQQRDGARLSQTIEVRRRDGSVWTAYARDLALPANPTDADRAAERAVCVLGLLAQAVAAADTARQARGTMLEWDSVPPPWAAHYG